MGVGASRPDGYRTADDHRRRLYVTTEVGQIFCLNADTGCTYWTMNAGAAVRAAMSVGPALRFLASFAPKALVSRRDAKSRKARREFKT